MVVTEVLLLRHGHRISWTLDPFTGKYSSSIPFPTRLPADPPLASHGVRQAQETGEFLEKMLGDHAKQDRLRVYSSLFYRCPETLRPTMERLRLSCKSDLTVRGERGIGEWFGKAWFQQPNPAEPSRLRADFFPWIDDKYKSRLIPDSHGELIQEIHDRLAKALDLIIGDVNKEYEDAGRGQEEVTILLCGHAAQIIATGRALTGNMPEDPDTDDFKCFTCGLSKFVPRSTKNTATASSDITNWRTNGGVAGGWDCVWNSWCGHLSQGEERGWHFHGDESFDSYGPGMLLTKTGATESVEDSNDPSSKL